MTFRGSMIALNARTGRIVWQTFVLPGNTGFAGGAFVNPPAIDVANGLVYGAAGQLYFQPDAVTACLAADSDNWDEACFPQRRVLQFSDRVRPAHRPASLVVPRRRSRCPPARMRRQSAVVVSAVGEQLQRVGLCRRRRQRVRDAHQGRRRDVVGIGQKSGVYWLLDARTGRLVWSRLVGHADDPGGIQWGTAFDGRRIYVAIGHNNRRDPYELLSGETVTGGSWAALHPADGRILWQTADPQWTTDPRGASDLAALSVANGIVYAGSMAHAGEQMYALDAASGGILWRFPAGGSVVAGPAIVRGTVYWGSGYARTGGVGNDKFYAFSIDGR